MSTRTFQLKLNMCDTKRRFALLSDIIAKLLLANVFSPISVMTQEPLDRINGSQRFAIRYKILIIGRNNTAFKHV